MPPASGARAVAGRRNRSYDRRDADAEHTYADTSKARDLLGYEPSHTIREGVAAFVDWYRENREWYEPLVVNSRVRTGSNAVLRSDAGTVPNEMALEADA
jgi:dTDP-D-glucose 4,6-dehydratase